MWREFIFSGREFQSGISVLQQLAVEQHLFAFANYVTRVGYCWRLITKYCTQHSLFLSSGAPCAPVCAHAICAHAICAHGRGAHMCPHHMCAGVLVVSLV